MEFHGRSIFGVLEKPLSLVTKFIFSLGNVRSSGSHEGDDGGHSSTSPSTHSRKTSNSLVPAFLLLTVGLLLATLTPLGPWLAAEGSPTLSQIFSFSRRKQTHNLPQVGESVSVWTKKKSGYYYCQGGTLFGNKPGEMMTQGAALLSGFQPAGGKYCANHQPAVASAASNNPSFVEKQPPASRVSSANATEASARTPERQPSSQIARKSVSVWAMQEFGSYYCQGDILFGSRPGRLMTQSEALKAGYEPSDTRCTNETPNQASAGAPPLGSQQPLTSKVRSANTMEVSIRSGKQPGSPVASNSVSVWVIKELGFYYCRGDVLFGHKPGQLMTQSEALTAGYLPSDTRCTHDGPDNASAERLTSQIIHGRR